MNNEGSSHVQAIADGCRAWRSGDDADGLEHFQKACLLWLEDLAAGQEQVGGDREAMLSLLSLMRKLLGSFKERDITYSTDILEYELLPVLQVHDVKKRGVDYEKSRP